jgi:hypothetical protein
MLFKSYIVCLLKEKYRLNFCKKKKKKKKKTRLYNQV